jgi:hypothetical protein
VTLRPMNTSSKQSKHAEGPGVSELARVATRALARAQRQAARENARFALPLIVVQKGRIVALPTGKAA